jgi:hypothetical protein
MGAADDAEPRGVVPPAQLVRAPLLLSRASAA